MRSAGSSPATMRQKRQSADTGGRIRRAYDAAMPLRSLALALLGGLALAAPAGAATTPFAYSTLTPLGLQRGEVLNPGYPVPVRDISYRSPMGGRVKGYLMVPPGKGRHPAVVYLHGAG